MPRRPDRRQKKVARRHPGGFRAERRFKAALWRARNALRHLLWVPCRSRTACGQPGHALQIQVASCPRLAAVEEQMRPLCPFRQPLAARCKAAGTLPCRRIGQCGLRIRRASRPDGAWHGDGVSAALPPSSRSRLFPDPVACKPGLSAREPDQNRSYIVPVVA